MEQVMNFQPPDPESFGSCLKCHTLVEESEQSGGICFECHAVDAGKEPAFPIGANEYGGHGTCFGITVRDHFATHAMQALISTAVRPSIFGLDGAENDTAKAAYKMADAMLAARSA
jgi:hypothetical protein